MNKQAEKIMVFQLVGNLMMSGTKTVDEALKQAIEIVTKVEKYYEEK